MLWTITCVDAADSGSLREQHVAAHRAHLMASKDLIVLAAPMQADDSASVKGTFFLIDVANRADAEKFTQGDAFVRNGVFQSVTITSLKQGLWNPAAVRA